MTLLRVIRAVLYLSALLVLVSCRSAAPALSSVPSLEQHAPVQPGVASWTSSRAAFNVGDVILVAIDEFTLAEANTQNRATNTRNNNLSSNIAAALKGNSLGDAGLDIGSQRSRDAARSGDATRRNRFSSEMSVRVLGFSKSGLLYVRGQRVVSIDSHQQTIQLSGWVRSQDVSAQNSVLSSRIGDAELVYAGNGSLDNAPAGLLTRVLGAVAP